jgi:hypothetical protein
VRTLRWTGFFAATAVLGLTAIAPASGGAAPASFIGGLAAASKVGSTVPANGDVNPYGLVVVPTSIGKLVAGNALISNYNSKANVQGTGTTIVEVAPNGTQQLFAQIGILPAGSSCPGGLGLSTALNILPGGWVVVGSLPTQDGNLPKTGSTGCLLVLNSNGEVAETFANPNIVGPWDMTAVSTPTSASLFVSNAQGGDTKETKKKVPVAGNGTIVRLNLTLSPTAAPVLTKTTIVGSGFPWKANKTALVLAPTGVALGSNGTLYVDNAETNTVSAIPQALTRSTPVVARSSVISKGGSLNAPLGMTLALNGDLLVVNGSNGVITEITPTGKQVAKHTLIKKGAGDLFGLALTPNYQGLYFVNDGDNTLQLAQP